LLAAPPAMLRLLCFRQEEVASKAFLQTLLDRGRRSGWSTLTLEPMNDDAARAVVGSLISTTSLLSDEARQRMTSEAAGSPFVLEQLALSAGAASETSGVPTFASVFQSRLSALQPDARLFLEPLALCGRPVAPDLLFEACGVARDRQSLVVRLRASRLIRSSGSLDHVETYHDRIREVIAGRILADAAREIHRRMAVSLTARQSDDCEALFEHYRGELREVSRRVPAVLEDARRRGNLYLATEVTTRSNFVWLAADDPDGGEREAMDAMSRWSEKGFHRQHYSFMLARVQTALYRGDSATAWRLLEERKSNLLAHHYLAGERQNHTLQTSDLVHEAWVRLFSSADISVHDRAHLVALMATQMRRALVDYARHRNAAKGPGAGIRVSLAAAGDVGIRSDEDVLALDEALNALEEVDARAVRIVEMRFFGGLRKAEAAEAVGVSVATLKRDWAFARAWLLDRLNGSA
jgi:RNA polymerase sigma factor (TIGR02999 family)